MLSLKAQSSAAASSAGASPSGPAQLPASFQPTLASILSRHGILANTRTLGASIRSSTPIPEHFDIDFFGFYAAFLKTVPQHDPTLKLNYQEILVILLAYSNAAYRYATNVLHKTQDSLKELERYLTDSIITCAGQSAGPVQELLDTAISNVVAKL